MEERGFKPRHNSKAMMFLLGSFQLQMLGTLQFFPTTATLKTSSRQCLNLCTQISLKLMDQGIYISRKMRKIVTTSFQSLSQATLHSLLQWLSWSVTLISFLHQIIALLSDSLKFTAALVGAVKENLISSAGAHADIVTCTVCARYMFSGCWLENSE